VIGILQDISDTFHLPSHSTILPSPWQIHTTVHTTTIL